MKSVGLIERMLEEEAVVCLLEHHQSVVDQLGLEMLESIEQAGHRVDVGVFERIVYEVADRELALLAEQNGLVETLVGLHGDGVLDEGVAGGLARFAGRVIVGSAKLAGSVGAGLVQGVGGDSDTARAAHNIGRAVGMATGRLAVGTAKLAWAGTKLAGRGLKRAGKAAKARYDAKVAKGCAEGYRMTFGVCRKTKVA